MPTVDISDTINESDIMRSSRVSSLQTSNSSLSALSLGQENKYILNAMTFYIN